MDAQDRSLSSSGELRLRPRRTLWPLGIGFTSVVLFVVGGVWLFSLVGEVGTVQLAPTGIAWLVSAAAGIAGCVTAGTARRAGGFALTLSAVGLVLSPLCLGLLVLVVYGH